MSSNDPSKKIRHVKSHRKKSFFPYLTVLFILLFSILLGSLYALFSDDGGTKKKSFSKKPVTLLVAKDKMTVLIMGVDKRKDDVGRSDTLMVAAIDPKAKRASILSIPRDTRVKIPRHGFDKINAAYPYGGRELTQETVENFLSTPIDHYVLVDLQSFQRIIDAIGGIDIEVEDRMEYEDPWDDEELIIDLYPGMQHMDGKTAMTYVRYRDEEGDIGRIKRQQKFMQAVMDKITSPEIILQIPTLAKEIIYAIDTDFSLKEIIAIAGTLKEARRNGLYTEMIEGRPAYNEEISYWLPDIKKIRTSVAEVLGVHLTDKMLLAMEKEEEEYEESERRLTLTMEENEEKDDAKKPDATKQKASDKKKKSTLEKENIKDKNTKDKNPSPLDEESEEEEMTPAVKGEGVVRKKEESDEEVVPPIKPKAPTAPIIKPVEPTLPHTPAKTP